MQENFKSIIQECIQVLKKDGTILYPTDTVWGIGCDATSEAAVEKVYALKKRPDTKALICLVSDIGMLNRYISEVPEIAYDLIELSAEPLTIVYDAPRGVARSLVSGDNTLAIRVTRDPFCQQLIRALKRPVVSTSANLAGAPTPGSYGEISSEILKGVDYIVPLRNKEKNSKPSAIIRLGTDGSVNVIRK